MRSAGWHNDAKFARTLARKRAASYTGGGRQVLAENHDGPRSQYGDPRTVHGAATPKVAKLWRR
jgi:hypothetical protein